MTKEEAYKLKSFQNYCTCGGFAAGSMNDRPVSDPHMEWCPQKAEYDEWYRALHPPQVCPRCAGKDIETPAADPHTCPYQEDINGDYETLCSCCEDCTQECAWDI